MNQDMVHGLTFVSVDLNDDNLKLNMVVTQSTSSMEILTMRQASV